MSLAAVGGEHGLPGKPGEAAKPKVRTLQTIRATADELRRSFAANGWTPEDFDRMLSTAMSDHRFEHSSDRRGWR